MGLGSRFSGFITDHAHLLDAGGRQRLVRHGFLPEREVMTGVGKVSVQVPRVRDRSVTADDSKISSARCWFRTTCATLRRSRRLTAPGQGDHATGRAE